MTKQDLLETMAPSQREYISMGYFPLLILLVDFNKTMVVNTPEEIPNGVTFTVLQCNYVKD